MLHEDNNREIDQIANAATTLPQLVRLTEDDGKGIASQRLALVAEAKVGEKGAEPLTQEEKDFRLRICKPSLLVIH